MDGVHNGKRCSVGALESQVPVRMQHSQGLHMNVHGCAVHI